jgi:hypothetical protein
MRGTAQEWVNFLVYAPSLVGGLFLVQQASPREYNASNILSRSQPLLSLYLRSGTGILGLNTGY